jgi:hypothetical protein
VNDAQRQRVPPLPCAAYTSAALPPIPSG